MNIRNIVNYFLTESKEDINYYSPKPLDQWNLKNIGIGFIRKNSHGNNNRSVYLVVRAKNGYVYVDSTSIYGAFNIAGKNPEFYKKLLVPTKDNSNLYEPIDIKVLIPKIKKYVEDNPESFENFRGVINPEDFYKIIMDF